MMDIRIRLAALAAACALPLASLPAAALQPFTADYQASYLGLQASGHMTLAPAGKDRWSYSLAITGMGAELKQNTVFEDRDGQWRPLSGTDSTRGTAGLAAMLVKKKDVSASYDWNGGTATWSGDVKPDRAGPVSLQAGDVDALLLNLALTRDVAAGRPLNYRMVDDGRAKALNCQASGRESVTVSGKAYSATKAVCDNGNKQIIVWVADGLPVPVRILQRRNGKDDIDLKLTRAG